MLDIKTIVNYSLGGTYWWKISYSDNKAYMMSLNKTSVVDVLNAGNNYPVVYGKDYIVTSVGNSSSIKYVLEDADFDDIVLSVGGAPKNGLVNVDGSIITYTPNELYIGDDQFVLNFDDGWGGVIKKLIYVTVNEGDERLGLQSSSDNYYGFSGDMFFFSAYAYADNISNIEYYWDFGDGETSTSQNPSHAFDQLGTYTVVVRASDQLGSIVTRSFTVNITYPILNGWDDSENMPEGRAHHTSVPYNGKMYIVGGYEGGGNARDIRIADIDASGTLSNWSTESIDWCWDMRDFQAVAYAGYLHVMGSDSCSEIRTAKINEDGSLGEWFTHSNGYDDPYMGNGALTTVGTGFKALTYNGYLYLVGGRSGTRSTPIYAYKLHSDGSISPDIITATTQTIYLNNYPATIYRGYMYIFGQSDYDLMGGLGISVGKINDDGTIGDFVYQRDHYVGQYEAAVAVNGKLFMSGGRESWEAPVSDTYSAVINEDGTLGPITVDSNLPAVRADHHMSAYGDYLYVTGGSAGDEMSGYEATVWSSKIGAAHQDAPILEDQQFLVTSSEDIVVKFTATEVGRPLSYQIIQLPSRGEISVLASGEYRYEHTVSGNGTDTFSVKVTDGVYEDNATVSITINDNAPIISGVSVPQIEIGEYYEFLPSSSDSDPSDTLSYSIDKLPAWATFDVSTGKIFGTPSENDVWTTMGQMVITVTDGSRSAQLEPFDLSVTKPPSVTNYIVQTASNVTPIALGWNTNSIVLQKDGNILGFSLDQYTDGSGTELDVDRTGQAVQVARGGYHTAVLMSDGTVETNGNNSDCQLGLSSEQSVLLYQTYGYLNYGSRVSVDGLTDIITLAAGNRHTLALKDDGTVWSWGDNAQGQLGRSGGDSCTAAQIDGLSDVVQIAAGELISLALKRDGTVWIWGRQGGTSPSRQLTGVDNIVQIAAGGTHSIALSEDGKVYTWGRAGGDYPLPSDNILPGLDNIVDIASGQYHGLALKNDGTVWAWGQNQDGQLGIGNQVHSDYPAQIPGFGDVVHISAGGYSSAAIKSDGTVWAWGRNTQSQLRDGTNENRSSPIEVDFGEVAFDSPPRTSHISLNLQEDTTSTSLLDATDSDSSELVYGLISLPQHGTLAFNANIPNTNNLVVKSLTEEKSVGFGKEGIANKSVELSGVASGGSLSLEVALPSNAGQVGEVALGLVIEQLDQQFEAHVVLDDISVNEQGDFSLAAPQYALWSLAPDGNTYTVQRDPATFISIRDGVLSVDMAALKTIINANITGAGVGGAAGHYHVSLVFSQEFDLHFRDEGHYFSYPKMALEGGGLNLKGAGGLYRTDVPWAQNTVSGETLLKIENGTLLQFELTVNGVTEGEMTPMVTQTPFSSTAAGTEKLFISHPVDSRYLMLSDTSAFQYLPKPDYEGTDSFTYSVRSGNKYSNVSTVSIIVAPENDPPTLVEPLVDRLVVENESFSISVPSNTFSDKDSSDSLSYVAELVDTDGALLSDGSLPIWISFDKETATFTGTPTDFSVGSYRIRVTVEDALGEQASSSFLLTVSEVNDVPTIQGVADQVTDEDMITGEIPIFIADIETLPSGLAVSGTSSNSNLVANSGIIIEGTGAERTVTVTPLQDQYGTTTITLTVTDGVDSSSTSFLLTVTPVDDSPSFGGSITNSSALPGNGFLFSPTIVDPDNSSFTYEIINKPDWVTFDTVTGELSGIPDAGDYGTYDDIQIRVTAGDKTVESSLFSISVGDETAPVVIASHNEGTYNAAQSIVLSCQDDGAGCGNIYYTVDGSEPATSSSSVLYSGAIELPAVTGSTVLKFVAEDLLGNKSSTSTIAYYIDVDRPQIDFVNIQDGDKFDVNTNWTNVVGAAVDAGAGLKNVEIMISNGEKYMSTSTYGTFFISTPVWNSVDMVDASIIGFENAWAFTFGSVNRNTLYAVTVRAEDNAGNVSELSYYVFVEDAAGGISLETSLTQSLSSQAIRQNQRLNIYGQISLLGRADVSLRGKQVTLTVTPPAGGGGTTELTTTTTDDLGHYVFSNLDLFTHKGSYTLTTEFEDSGILVGSSASNSVLVGASAGYAIVVHGKFQPISGEPEGFSSHKKSTNRIYQKLIERGFAPENINYLNFDTAAKGYSNLTGVSVEEPTKEKIQDAIESWAKQKINDVPAPLYLVMVDHGEPNAFYIGQKNESGTVRPSDINQWLTNLENGLTTSGLEEDRVVVLGACYSGSFINVLSKPGRTIVSSAAADERSYKGSKEPDGIRVGEFFIEELFKELGHGYSLEKAFSIATHRTESKFHQRGASSNSTNKYFDKAKQHPLLDDNGDGKGSNRLTEKGDGKKAKSIFLGVGKTFDTNSVENPAEFIDSIPTQTLSAGDSIHQTLWAIDNVGGDAPTAWLEIMTPESSLDGSGDGFFQIEVDLPHAAMIFNASNQRWEIDTADISDFDGFTTPGSYSIYYYIKDKDTGEVSSPYSSTLYKAKVGNSPPAAFNLASPANNSETEKLLVLDWESTTDPESDPITYTLTVASDSNFNTILLNREGLNSSTSWIDSTVALQDQTDYYWKVTAVDLYGATTESSTYHFTTNFTNSIPGIVQGIVFSNSDNSMLGGATLELSNGKTITTEVDGSFLASLLPGNYTATLKPYGSITESVQVANLAVTASEVNRYLVGIQSTTQTTPTAPTNNAPQISGTPMTTLKAGESYSVTITATDADGDTLTFSSTNLPTWITATQSTNSYTLTGTPTESHVGSYSNIQISVTDGTDSTSLNSFNITVTTAETTAPTTEKPLILHGGWNLAHFNQTTALTTIKQQVPEIEAIWGWLNCEKQWQHALYTTEGAPITSDGFASLTPGRGYWVKLNDSVEERQVSLTGTVATSLTLSTATIYQGWNSVGVTESVILSPTEIPDEISSIWGWEEYWVSYVDGVPQFLNGLQGLDKSKGYFVYSGQGGASTTSCTQ